MTCLHGKTPDVQIIVAPTVSIYQQEIHNNQPIGNLTALSTKYTFNESFSFQLKFIHVYFQNLGKLIFLFYILEQMKSLTL